MEAIYYREHYYLLPREYKDWGSFIKMIKSLQAPVEISTYEMHENYELEGPVQKGISFSPYFIDGYNLCPQSITFEEPNEIYPAEIEILTQDEYNKKLREVISEYCPGCIFYKPLSKNVRSLNGHFDEISLDKLCFIRQETKPSPNYFISWLRSIGGYWHYHRSPDGETCEQITWSLNNWLKLKYDSATFSQKDGNLLILSHKKDFFTKVLTALVNQYIYTWITNVKLRIQSSDEDPITENDILEVISPKNSEKFRKSCKKYGVSIGILEFDQQAEKEIELSLQNPVKKNIFYPILKQKGKIYFLLTDTPVCLKELHFRHPMLSDKHAKITVYSQYGVKEYTINRYMPSTDLAACA